MRMQDQNSSILRQLSEEEVIVVGGGYYTEATITADDGGGTGSSGIDGIVDLIIDGAIEVAADVIGGEVGDWLDSFGAPSNEDVINGQFDPGGVSGHGWAQGSDGVYYVDRDDNGAFDLMFKTDLSKQVWCSDDGETWERHESGHDHEAP